MFKRKQQFLNDHEHSSDEEGDILRWKRSSPNTTIQSDDELLTTIKTTMIVETMKVNSLTFHKISCNL